MKKFLSILICIILFGCNSGINGSADNGNQNQEDPQDITTNRVLSLSNVATIPTTADQQSSATLLLTNNTGMVVHGVTISFDSGDYSGVNIFSKCDGDLAVGQSCQINLTLPAELQQGSFQLKVEGTSAKGQYVSRQLVSYANVAEVNGIEAGEFNDQIIAASGNKVTLAIPFRKIGNYQVQVRVDSSGDNNPVNETVCNSDNSQCTELVSITPHNDNEVNVSFLNNNFEVLTTVSAAVIMNAIGNLVTPTNNVIISKSDGVTPAAIQLLNNGYAPISNIRLFSSNPAFAFNTSSCNIIAANGSCTATITANSKVNGFGSVTVMYDTTSSTGQVYQNKTTSFNASYLAESGAAGLGLTLSGDSFVNNWVGELRNAYLTIKNTGVVTIDSIQITSVASQNANVSVTGYGANACATDGTQSLEPNASCVVRVNYNPSTPEAGILTMNFSGKYLDSQDVSGAGKVSVLSDAVSLNYDSNFRVVYLMTGNSQNGVTRCNLTNNGKSLTDCSVTGVSGSNNNSTVLSNTGVLGLSSFMSNDGMLSAYVGATKNSGSDFAKCNASESGLLSNCSSMMSSSGLPLNGVSGANTQNTIANINGKNYLYIAMSNSGRAINKCLINESNGSLSNCVSQTAKFPYQGGWFRGVVINGNYAYITRTDNETLSNLVICTVNQSTGDFDACTGSANISNTTHYLVVKTLGSTKYLFLTKYSGANTEIQRCSINSANGLLNNDCATVTTLAGVNANGLTLLTTSGLDYLYYADSSTNNVYRAQLNSDGSISNPEQVSASGTRLTGAMYLSPLLEYPQMKIAYAPSINIYYPNNTYVESLYISANVKMIKNTTVTLSAPSGITVSPATINFTASTTRVPVSISVASGVAAGAYTITGTASNGTAVPSFTVNVVRPQIASYTPVTGRGITNNLSTGLNTRNSSFAFITFTQSMNIASGTINGVKLQYSANNSTFSDLTSAYSWNVTTDKKIAYLVINGSNLTNGYYYRIVVDKSLLKDLNGNSISSVSGYEELTRFRAALKIYVTSRAFDGNLGDLGGADAKCNDVNNGKPNDGEYYKAVLAAQKNSKSQTQRFPGTNWVLLSYTDYYRSNGGGLVVFGRTDDLGRLNTIYNQFNNGLTPWTGFDGSNWGIQERADNYACNNWTVGQDSWTVHGRYANLNDSGSGWSNGGDANCRNTREIICAQQVN